MPDPSKIVGIDAAAVTRWFDELAIGFAGATVEWIDALVGAARKVADAAGI
jgi:hypothetical protein